MKSHEKVYVNTFYKNFKMYLLLKLLSNRIALFIPQNNRPKSKSCHTALNVIYSLTSTWQVYVLLFSLCVAVVPVNVSCTRTEFQIQVSRQALPQLDRENIYLGNPSCSAQLTETSYKIQARFVNCGTAGQVYKIKRQLLKCCRLFFGIPHLKHP